MLLARQLNLSLLASIESVYLSIAALSLIIYMLPGIFFCKLRGPEYARRLFLRPFSPRHIYLIFLSGLVMVFGCGLWKCFLCRVGLFRGEFAAYAAFTNVTSAANIADLVCIVIALALVPALCEEFLFRGILLREYRDGGYGGLCAILVSSLLYAMLHFSFERLPIYLWAGLVLGSVAVITRSVLASFCVNFVGGMFNLFLEDYIRQFMESEYRLLFLFLMVCVFLLALFLLLGECSNLFRDDGRAGVPLPQPPQRSHSSGYLLTEAVVTPTFLLCIVLFIVGTITKF